MADAGPRGSPVRVAVVAIGRNEGGRLAACLDSLTAAGAPVVYVDSGSTDDSVRLTKEHGFAVHELTPDRPFSAARARNEGYEQLATLFGGATYVQFLDADCAIDAAWLEAGTRFLDDNPDCAAVIGTLSEREPELNVYHRLCAMEWEGPAGDIEDCNGFGGISLIRGSAFAAIGGFNTSMIAGEDPELAVRLKLAGHRVTKIDVPMAVHDAEITRFSQYWRRAVRSGHAAGQRAHLHGRSAQRDGVRDVRSVVFWGLAVPAGALALSPLSTGASLAVGGGGYGALAYRVYRHRRAQGNSSADAALYAGAMIVAKFAQLIGLATFYRRAVRADYRLIEYK